MSQHALKNVLQSIRHSLYVQRFCGRYFLKYCQWEWYELYLESVCQFKWQKYGKILLESRGHYKFKGQELMGDFYNHLHISDSRNKCLLHTYTMCISCVTGIVLIVSNMNQLKLGSISKWLPNRFKYFGKLSMKHFSEEKYFLQIQNLIFFFKYKYVTIHLST